MHGLWIFGTDLFICLLIANSTPADPQYLQEVILGGKGGLCYESILLIVIDMIAMSVKFNIIHLYFPRNTLHDTPTINVSFWGTARVCRGVDAPRGAVNNKLVHMHARR